MRKRDAVRLMRANLLRRRSAIRQSLDSTRSQLGATNDREVGDSVDFALDAEHHEISSQLAQVESTELAQIDVALERMATGEYGVCDDCGHSIPLARLQAVPYATLCIKCQREQERTSCEQHNSSSWVSGSDRGLMLNGNGVGV